MTITYLADLLVYPTFTKEDLPCRPGKLLDTACKRETALRRIAIHRQNA